jgi:hypothetical protein
MSSLVPLSNSHDHGTDPHTSDSVPSWRSLKSVMPWRMFSPLSSRSSVATTSTRSLPRGENDSGEMFGRGYVAFLVCFGLVVVNSSSLMRLGRYCLELSAYRRLVTYPEEYCGLQGGTGLLLKCYGMVSTEHVKLMGWLGLMQSFVLLYCLLECPVASFLSSRALYI